MPIFLLDRLSHTVGEWSHSLLSRNKTECAPEQTEAKCAETHPDDKVPPSAADSATQSEILPRLHASTSAVSQDLHTVQQQQPLHNLPVQAPKDEHSNRSMPSSLHEPPTQPIQCTTQPSPKPEVTNFDNTPPTTACTQEDKDPKPESNTSEPKPSAVEKLVTRLQTQRDKKCYSQIVTYGAQTKSDAPRLTRCSTALSVFMIWEGDRQAERWVENDIEYIGIGVEAGGCEWGSDLVVHGYNWQEESIWIVRLESSEMKQAKLEQILGCISTLGCAGSRVIIDVGLNLVTFDMAETGRRCGLEVIEEEEEEVIVLGWSRDDLSDETVTQDTTTVGSMSRGGSTTGLGGEIEEEGKWLRFELAVHSLPMHLARDELSVIVIGSDERLGNWDARKAKRMEGSVCERDGVLRAEVHVRTGSDVEYKYCAIDGQAQIVAWEAGWNRSATSDVARGHCFRDSWRWC